MATQIFRLTTFDEDGPVQGSLDNPNNLRLVCNIDGGGKPAIWGSVGSRQNIDTVQVAGMPCTVECECIPAPGPWASKFNHSYWVPENRKPKVLSK